MLETTEDLNTITVNVTNRSGGSIGLKMAAPLIPFNVEASITSPITCQVPTATVSVSSPVGIEFQYSLTGEAPWQSSPSFAGLAEGEYKITARQISTGCESTSNMITVTKDVICADLSLTKTVNNATPNVGENLTFTLTVKNNGPQATIGVKVEDILPAGLTLSSYKTLVNDVETAGITYDAVSGLWDISSLTINNNDIIKLETTVTVGPNCGTISNTAEIITSSVEDTDSTPGNGN